MIPRMSNVGRHIPVSYIGVLGSYTHGCMLSSFTSDKITDRQTDSTEYKTLLPATAVNYSVTFIELDNAEKDLSSCCCSSS